MSTLFLPEPRTYFVGHIAVFGHAVRAKQDQVDLLDGCGSRWWSVGARSGLAQLEAADDGGGVGDDGDSDDATDGVGDSDGNNCNADALATTRSAYVGCAYICACITCMTCVRAHVRMCAEPFSSASESRRRCQRSDGTGPASSARVCFAPHNPNLPILPLTPPTPPVCHSPPSARTPALVSSHAVSLAPCSRGLPCRVTHSAMAKT